MASQPKDATTNRAKPKICPMEAGHDYTARDFHQTLYVSKVKRNARHVNNQNSGVATHGPLSGSAQQRYEYCIVFVGVRAVVHERYHEFIGLPDH